MHVNYLHYPLSKLLSRLSYSDDLDRNLYVGIPQCVAIKVCATLEICCIKQAMFWKSC